eukprot:10452859-Ditylum_brightwellii.AAC.1
MMDGQSVSMEERHVHRLSLAAKDKKKASRGTSTSPTWQLPCRGDNASPNCAVTAPDIRHAPSPVVSEPVFAAGLGDTAHPVHAGGNATTRLI